MVIYAKANFTFEPGQEGDLGFEEGDIITVLRKDESGWWTGRTRDGREGDFPYNYVEVLSDRDADRVRKGQQRTAGGGRKGATVSFSGDRVVSARIVGVERRSDGRYLFKVDASTKSGKRRNAQKLLLHFRELDDQLRKLFPSFESVLPPAWADQIARSSEDQADCREVLNEYLERLVHTDGVDFLLMSWMFPGEKVAMTGGLGGSGGGGSSQAGGTSSRARAEQRMKMPIMAKVIHNWEPKDEVEVRLVKGEYIAVLEQKTGSPGWWDGQRPAGRRGLFPYNHVKLVDPAEARAVLNGQTPSSNNGGSSSAMKRLSGKVGNGMKKVAQQMSPKPSGKPRRKKVIPNFSIATLKGFDDLIDKGWCIEGEGSAAPKAKGPTPKPGQSVTLHYTGYLWDCQKQCVMEFASSDDPSGDGPMQFTVGSGGDIIAAINEAVQYLDVGVTVRLACTPQKGYGEVGAPPEVPPNSHLVYELTLKDIGHGGGGSKGGFDNQSMASSKSPTTRPRQTAAGGRNNGGNSHMKPVPSRSQRSQAKNTYATPHVKVSRDPQVAQQPRAKEHHQVFSLRDLQRFVKEKTLEAHGIDPASIEDHLSDRDFKECFGVDRSGFLLKPLWRQKAMKRTVGLF